MLFSVIVPIYNVAPYLGMCLDSILSQGENFEVVCVDDGSTDEGGTIADEYAVNYPMRVKVIHQENKGLSGARNTGLKEAHGDYVIFVDSDDVLLEGYFEEVATSIKENNRPDVLTVNLATFTRDKGEITNHSLYNHEESCIYKTGEDYVNDFVQERGWGPSAVWRYVYRRDYLELNGLVFLEGVLHEDELFVPESLYMAKTVVVINKTFYLYRMRSSSIIHRQTQKNLLDKYIVLLRLDEFLKQKRLNSKSSKRIRYNLARHIISGYREQNMIPQCKLMQIAITNSCNWMELLKIFRK